MPSPGKAYTQERTCPSLHTCPDVTEFRSLSNMNQETILDTFVLLLPTPDHKPSKAGFISVTVQYLVHQSTHTDISFSSKSIFKSKQAPSPLCWLAEGSRDEGSSMAQATDALPEPQCSPHLPQTRPPAPSPTALACSSQKWQQYHSLS